MVSLNEVLELNWIILYFVYGQVFFLTGLVTGLQWRRHSALALARPLPWLAAFGITHGLNEWGHIFIPLQALYLPNSAVQLMTIAHLLVLAISFFFLFQFGIELVLPSMSGFRWLRVVPPVALLLWATAVFLRGISIQEPVGQLVSVGDGWSRYMLCFPGAILASIGLFRQAGEVRALDMGRIATYLAGAGYAFLFYALVGGLIVPPAPYFPANTLNYATVIEAIQTPTQVFRSLCGLAMAIFITRSLEIFQVESDRRLAEMEQAQILATDRERIGRELHDGIVQNIYAAGLALEEAHLLVPEDPPQAQSRIQAVMSALNVAIQDIRRYIFDLQTVEQTRELEQMLEGLVQDLRLDTMLEVDLEVVGQRCCWLPSEQVAHVTQIAREALSNVVQHAQASHVMVRLSYVGNATYLTIADDGQGLDLHADRVGKLDGQGIANMQARARMLGGQLTLRNGLGHGLALELVIPCEGSKAPLPDMVEDEAWV